jgi:hypothetical protein
MPYIQVARRGLLDVACRWNIRRNRNMWLLVFWITFERRVWDEAEFSTLDTVLFDES